MSHVSPSPSFNSYSSETLAEIAARVIHELHSDHTSDVPLYDTWPPNAAAADDDTSHNNKNAGDNSGDDDFEFSFLPRDSHYSSPVSAGDIFYNGQIRPMYPLFDRSLLDGISSISINNQNAYETASFPRRRLPLRKLMFEERETGSCSSSTSEAEDIDLESIAPGTYCVWNPKSSSNSNSNSSSSCKKSSSTGSSSSKRWKFRDLILPRSHSDGKVPPLVVFAASKKDKEGGRNGDVASEKVFRQIAPAKEEEKEGSKRKQSLAYRQEFIGLFTNVNGLGRNLRPF